MTSIKPILLVEDDPNDAELLRLRLQAGNLANPIVTTSDGVEALEYLEQCDAAGQKANGLPAFVLLDLHLPRRDGLELLQMLSASERYRHMPVILMTGSEDESAYFRRHHSEVKVCLVKPGSVGALLDAVNETGLGWRLTFDPDGLGTEKPHRDDECFSRLNSVPEEN